MPHFTIQYSANLDALIDMADLCEVVRRTAVTTGIFPLGGIRVRAVRCEHFAIADGRAGLGFLDVLLRIGEGRSLDARRAAGDQIFAALCDALAPVLADHPIALSFDIQINDKETSWKRNSIHDLLRAEAERSKTG
ncbi:MAG: 5-carboxymethyl-2-hydroxymuconate Delta-isomerase [Tardiphaga sp.]